MGRRLVGLLQMALIMLGSVVVSLVSYIVFGVLDLLDPLLCVVYKVVDYLVEAEWKPCYCFSAQKDCSSKSRRSILVNSPEGKTKIVCHCLTKVQMEDISDTLYSRKPLFRELVMSTVFCIKKLRVMNSKSSIINQRLRTATSKPAFPVNSSTIVESLQAHKGQLKEPLSPRWSDCDCHTCASWHSSCKETLFVKVEGRGSEIFDVPQENNNNNNHNLKASASDVIFIHGFISSSTFWTETVFPNFSELTKSKYRLFAVDLLGFGRSPKPTDSLYTLTEHVDMIERSVLRPHRVKSFHVVAHSLGCIIALALAARFPGAVSSLTLLAPPYFPVPRGVGGSDFVLRQLAPKKVWHPLPLGLLLLHGMNMSVELFVCSSASSTVSGTSLLSKSQGTE